MGSGRGLEETGKRSLLCKEVDTWGFAMENNGSAWKNSMSMRLQKLVKCLVGGEEQNMFCWGLKWAREIRGEKERWRLRDEEGPAS